MPGARILGGAELAGDGAALLGGSALAVTEEAAATGDVQLGLAEEVDEALALTLSEDLSIGLAEEIDEALAVDLVDAGVLLGLAEEVDEALPIALVEDVALGLAEEVDEALSLIVGESIELGLAEEIDEAFSVFIPNTDSQESNIICRIRPNEVAPGGVGGEALFSTLYFVLEYDTDVELTITPILDGEKITAESTTVTRLFGADGKQREEFEVGLRRDHEAQSRQGLRGTWFTVEIVVEDIGNSGGNVNLEGMEIEYEVVRELHPARSYTPENLQAVSFDPIGFFLFGEKGGARILEADSGADDAGIAIEARARPNWIAPAGVGGECLFSTVYLAVTRDNSTDLTMELVPILDGEELPVETVDFPGIVGTVTEVRELNLSRAHESESRYGLRGTWFTVEWRTAGALPEDADIVLEGAEVEYEPLREQERAANAT